MNAAVRQQQLTKIPQKSTVLVTPVINLHFGKYRQPLRLCYKLQSMFHNNARWTGVETPSTAYCQVVGITVGMVKPIPKV